MPARPGAFNGKQPEPSDGGMKTDRDREVGPHVLSHVDRQGISHPAVDHERPAEAGRRENPGNGDAGPDGVQEVTIPKDDRIAAVIVGRDDPQGDGKVLDLGLAGNVVIKKDHGFPAGEKARAGEGRVKKLKKIIHLHGAKILPQLFQRPGCVNPGHDRSDARSSDEIDGNTQIMQGFEDRDMDDAAGSAAAEDEPNLGAGGMSRRGRLFCGHGFET